MTKSKTAPARVVLDPGLWRQVCELAADRELAVEDFVARLISCGLEAETRLLTKGERA
jgi:hypothetical protein